MTLLASGSVLRMIIDQKKMKDSFKIAEIIHDYLFGELSEEGCWVLDEWLDESGKHGEMLRQFRQMGYVDEKMVQHRIFNAEKGFCKFEESKKRRNRRVKFIRTISVAAVFCCGISVAVFLLWNPGKRDQVELASAADPIVPGGLRAVLMLENGQNVELANASTLKVTEESTVVTVKDNQVVYAPEDPANEYATNRVYTPRGGEYSLELSDGTKVWLNAETELRYPVKFKKDRREVEIIGEGYFEVTKDTDRPFIVHANGIKTRVLGTSFNVKAYANEERQTTLLEGSVEVFYRGQRVKIIPGEQVTLKEERLEVREVDTRVSMGWKNGLFIFDDLQLENVLQELGRWYDVHIFIANEEVKQLKFTSNFPRYENIDRVLDIIELAACVKCEIKGRTIVVRMDN